MEMLDLDSVDWKASKKDRNKNGPKWKMLTPMSTPRSSHTVEVFKVQILRKLQKFGPSSTLVRLYVKCPLVGVELDIG